MFPALTRRFEVLCRWIGLRDCRRQSSPPRLVLRGKDGKSLTCKCRLTLRPFEKTRSRPSLTLQVNDLGNPWTKCASSVSWTHGKPRAKRALVCPSPSTTRPGHPSRSCHQTIASTPRFEEPKIYNWFCPGHSGRTPLLVDKLGLVVRSNRFLPKDLPLDHADKSFCVDAASARGIRASDRSITNSPLVIFLGHA